MCVGVTAVCVRVCGRVCTGGTGTAAGVCMCAWMLVHGNVQWLDCTVDKLYCYCGLLVGWAQVSIGS